MCLHWPWLSQVITTPYVPTLGPVHPATLSADLFRAVIDTGDQSLPYDHHKRWATRKDEWVIADRILHEPDVTVIPTWSTAQRTVTAYCYGTNLAAAHDLIDTLCLDYAATGRVVSFPVADTQPRRGHTVRVLLKKFTGNEQPTPAPVRELRRCEQEIRSQFGEFARNLSALGFAFLHDRLDTVGPVLVAVASQQIVGAIGPMDTMQDASGLTRLLPQYWGVLPEHRGRGYGRALWQAAMAWGQAHGARYQLLQTARGSASEWLCLDEGLTSLGYVHKDIPIAGRAGPPKEPDQPIKRWPSRTKD